MQHRKLWFDLLPVRLAGLQPCYIYFRIVADAYNRNTQRIASTKPHPVKPLREWNRKDEVMFVDRIIPTARKRLVTIPESAKLLEAAKLLRNADTDIVVVCASDGLLAGVITKTDVVNQISHCQGDSCTTAASSVMTRDVVVCRSGDLLYGVWSK